jgi:predicted lysophospholipase L1 biosynthesis ABC-type transport system permease subunit
MLATTVRRRRCDLAVLHALGLSRRQTRVVLAAQASTVAVVGVALGVPLGVIAGHLIWRSITSSMPLAYVAPGFVLAAGLVIPAAFVVVNAVAVWPANAAARIHAAAMLRAE